MKKIWQKILVVMITVFATWQGSLAYYQKAATRSSQSEAQITLVYLATLQNAYFADKSQFVFWSDPYGLLKDGAKNCGVYEATKELGLRLVGCDRDVEAGGPRYSYIVKPSIDGMGFEAVAQSGTLRNGVSSVCRDRELKDQWKIDQSKKLTHTLPCSK